MRRCGMILSVGELGLTFCIYFHNSDDSVHGNFVVPVLPMHLVNTPPP